MLLERVLKPESVPSHKPWIATCPKQVLGRTKVTPALSDTGSGSSDTPPSPCLSHDPTGSGWIPT